MDKRNERMLEDALKQPGNETCADCHAPAPRWASVNLGIFLCVTCASVHRKLGTHKSRVKSVTLDTWTRDQIKSMQTQGNTLSNSIYNPNETVNPPPNATGAEERDSDLEKYIRRKYEMGAFKAGVRVGGAGPSSLARARERNGATGGSVHGGVRENVRNPELNGIISVKRGGDYGDGKGSSGPAINRNGSGLGRDRDLPALPADASGLTPRARPIVKSAVPVMGKSEEGKLIDFGGDEGNEQTGASSSSNGAGNSRPGTVWASPLPQQQPSQPIQQLQQPNTQQQSYGQSLFPTSNPQAGPSFTPQYNYNQNLSQPSNYNQSYNQHPFPTSNFQQMPFQSQQYPQAQSPYNPFQQQQTFVQPQQQSFAQPNNQFVSPNQQGQQYFAQGQQGFAMQQGVQAWAGSGGMGYGQGMR